MCNARYLVAATGIPTTCQREAGHDSAEVMGPNATPHARVAIIGDTERGWGSYGPATDAAIGGRQ
jgi:hypothetical protein